MKYRARWNVMLSLTIVCCWPVLSTTAKFSGSEQSARPDGWPLAARSLTAHATSHTRTHTESTQSVGNAVGRCKEGSARWCVSSTRVCALRMLLPQNHVRCAQVWRYQWRHCGWCHPGRQLMVSPYFFFKKLTTFFQPSSLESDELFKAVVS